MAKKKSVKDINIGDKVILIETGFEYLVSYITDASILIRTGEQKIWIPKSLIEIMDSLLSTHNYRLFKFKALPDWFITKNEIK